MLNYQGSSTATTAATALGYFTVVGTVLQEIRHDLIVLLTNFYQTNGYLFK